jgi:hypothetical protein
MPDASPLESRRLPLRRRALQRPFIDRQIEYAGHNAQRDASDPDQLIGTGQVEQHAPQPYAQETAYLVTEEHHVPSQRKPIAAENT